MPKAKKYYQLDGKGNRIASTFDPAAYAADHPNTLSRTGLTFNEEIAEAIRQSIAERGYDRVHKIEGYTGVKNPALHGTQADKYSLVNNLGGKY